MDKYLVLEKFSQKMWINQRATLVLTLIILSLPRKYLSNFSAFISVLQCGIYGGTTFLVADNAT